MPTITPDNESWLESRVLVLLEQGLSFSQIVERVEKVKANPLLLSDEQYQGVRAIYNLLRENQFTEKNDIDPLMMKIKDRVINDTKERLQRSERGINIYKQDKVRIKEQILEFMSSPLQKIEAWPGELYSVIETTASNKEQFSKHLDKITKDQAKKEAISQALEISGRSHEAYIVKDGQTNKFYFLAFPHHDSLHLPKTPTGDLTSKGILEYATDAKTIKIELSPEEVVEFTRINMEVKLKKTEELIDLYIWKKQEALKTLEKLDVVMPQGNKETEVVVDTSSDSSSPPLDEKKPEVPVPHAESGVVVHASRSDSSPHAGSRASLFHHSDYSPSTIEKSLMDLLEKKAYEHKNFSGRPEDYLIFTDKVVFDKVCLQLKEAGYRKHNKELPPPNTSWDFRQAGLANSLEINRDGQIKLNIKEKKLISIHFMPPITTEIKPPAVPAGGRPKST